MDRTKATALGLYVVIMLSVFASMEVFGSRALHYVCDLPTAPKCEQVGDREWMCDKTRITRIK